MWIVAALLHKLDDGCFRMMDRVVKQVLEQKELAIVRRGACQERLVGNHGPNLASSQDQIVTALVSNPSLESYLCRR
jgi:hypothetical protein